MKSDAESFLVRSLKRRIAVLTEENRVLREKIGVRLTSQEVKERIRQMSEDGYNSFEISEKMTLEGEPIKPEAVRKALSRMNKPAIKDK